MEKEMRIRSGAWRWAGVIIAMIIMLAALCVNLENTYADDEYPGTVYFNLTDDGLPVMSDVTGEAMMMVPVKLQDVADVDLADWDLEEFTYEENGTPNPGRPTVLKLYLLMLDRYKDDPQGSIVTSGSPGSLYMTKYWGHDENLNYYVNGAYPLAGPNWGATCDAVALEDDDRVDVMMLSDWNFYTDSGAGFNFFASASSEPEDGDIVSTYEVRAGEPLPVQVIRGFGNLNNGGATTYQAADDLVIHVSGKDAPIDLGDSVFGNLDAGRAEITFDEPGTYYIWVKGGTGDNDTVVQSGAAAKVNVTGDPQSPENVLPINFSTSNGSVDTVTITDGSGNIIENVNYDVVPGTNGNYTIDVTLPHSYDPRGSVKAVFSRTPGENDYPYVTPNDNRWAGIQRNQTYGGRTDAYSDTLSAGAATRTVYIYEGNSRNTASKKGTITIRYALQNSIPKRVGSVPETVDETIVASETYSLDLSTIFSDEDGDVLTYKVKVDNAAAVAADKNYTFTTDQMGTYTLVFSANDGIKDSTETYTVKLEVTRKAGTFYVTHINGTGYTTEAAEGSSSPVNEGSPYKIKLNLAQGYQRGENFAVKANGVTIPEDSADSNTFTIQAVTEDQQITVEGVTEKQPVIIAPIGSRISVGYQTGYFKKIWIDPVKTEILPDRRVKNTYSPVSNNQLFYRVQNPQGVTYYKFITALNRGDEIEVNEEKLFINDDSFTKETKRDRSGNIADVYLPINPAGYVNVAPGATSELNCFRNWLPVNSTLSNDKEGIPDFHYQVVDANGLPSDLVTITPDTYNSGVATLSAGSGTGMAIVKVTYDAMYVDGNNNYGPKFGAIWPERTGVFVVTVGDDGTGIETNMNIDQVNDSPRRIDAEHDPLFYTGSKGAEYSFTPESGTTVSVARPTVGASTLTYTGFTSEGVTVDSEGKVTVSGLITGRNIIRVTKGDVSSYQVITAQEISYTLKDSQGNAIDNDAKIAPGTAVTLTFSGLTSPSEKFSGKYNFNFRTGLKGENGTLFQEASPGGFGVYNFTTKDHSLAVTIPQDWTEATYKLTSGGIIKSGFSGGDGTHRTSNYGAGGGMAWGSQGVGAKAYGAFPTITLNVQQPPVRKAGVEAQVEQELAHGGTYNVKLSDVFDDPNGDALTYTVSVNGAEPVAADENYSYTAEGTDSVTLVFKANDGKADSTDTYTVNITVTVHTHNMTGHPATDATCTAAGNTEYYSCDQCNKYFSDEAGKNEIDENSWVIPAKDHDWEDPSYTWSDDNSKVAAKRVCKTDPTHIEEEEVATSSTVTREATLTEEGETTYTSAAFRNTAFQVQIKKVNTPKLEQGKIDGSSDNNDPNAGKVEAKTVTVNVKTVNKKAINKAVAKAGGTTQTVTTIVIGKKAKKISKGAFSKYKNATTLQVKSKKLTKKSVKGSLKGSKIKNVKVKVGSKKLNKKYVKKYKKIFTKKNAGKKVKVTK